MCDCILIATDLDKVISNADDLYNFPQRVVLISLLIQIIASNEDR